VDSFGTATTQENGKIPTKKKERNRRESEDCLSKVLQPRYEVSYLGSNLCKSSMKTKHFISSEPKVGQRSRDVGLHNNL
jgi:hypothetical protein